MTTSRTPLQRTAEKPAAAERDAPAHPDRPSRGLPSVQRVGQGTASRAPGYSVPRSAAVPPALTLESQALRALHTHRPRPASSRPVPGRRSGVNRCAIQHNRALRKPGQSLRWRFAWWPGALAPSRVRVMVGYVWRPGPSAAVPTAFAPLTAAWRARAARQHEGLARRCAQGGGTSPRPPRAVCCAGLQRCALLAPCSPPSLPSAPKGAPRRSKATPNGHPGTVGGKLPPFAQGA